MKNILLTILFLSLLLSCNKENTAPILKNITNDTIVDLVPIIPEDPTLFGVHVNQPIGEIYKLFVDTPKCYPIRYIGINETGNHIIWVFPRDTIVIAYIIFSELVDRNYLYNAEYINQISTMYNYGINNDILFSSPIIRDLMLVDTTLSTYRHEEYSHWQGKDALFELKGLTYNSTTRSATIQACKNGFSLIISSKKSTNIYEVIKL
jgi:hypothetical protein